MAVVGTINILAKIETARLKADLRTARDAISSTFGKAGAADIRTGLGSMRAGIGAISAGLGQVRGMAGELVGPKIKEVAATYGMIGQSMLRGLAPVTAKVREVGQTYALIGQSMMRGISPVTNKIKEVGQTYAMIGRLAMKSMAPMGQMLSKGVGKLAGPAGLGALGLGSIGVGLGQIAKGAGTMGLDVMTLGLNKLASAARSTIGPLMQMGGILVGLGVGGAVAMFAMAKSSLKAMDTTAELAQQLGVSTQALTGLQYAAQLTGTDAEVVGASLEKMNTTLGKVALTSKGPAIDVLKKIGIDAKELAAMNPADKLVRLSEGFMQLHDPADRAAASAALFGKANQSMLNMMSAGPEKIRALMAEAQALGLTFDELAAAKVGAANDAMDRMGFALQGVGNQMAIQLAPLVSFLGEQFIKMASDGGGMGAIVGSAVEYVATGIGMIADVVQFLGAAFTSMQALATGALGMVYGGVAVVAEGIQIVINYLQGKKLTFGTDMLAQADAMVAKAKQLGDEGAAKFAAPSASTQVATFFGTMRDGANASAAAIAKNSEATKGMGKSFSDTEGRVASVIEKLKEEIATVNMSEAQKELWKLQQDGATAAELKEATALSKVRDGLKDQKKDMDQLKAKGEKIHEEGKGSPVAIYKKEMADLQALQTAGTITKGEFDLQSAKAFQTLQEGAAKGIMDPSMRAGALELGSKEARSALLAARGVMTTDPMKTVAENTKQQLAQQQEQTRLSAQMLAALQGPSTGLGLASIAP